ncbi:MAG TPA: response regulator [Gemmatimonadaceae bacterium]|nr:response regulator [Gemmatimonadaceae bacterium]
MSDSRQADAGVTVLVVDDEPQIRRVVRNVLDGIAGRVLEASSAREGLDLAASAQPSLVILDLSLPDLDGLEVCRDLRAFSTVPLIVLSARHSDQDKAALLDAGADDYVTKPFSTLELQARVRAQLRRAASKGAASEKLVAGGVEIDVARRVVRRSGVEVHLTPTEWALLRAFVANRGRTLTHRQLFNAVWGRAEGDAQQYLRVYVGQLRRKLEADPVRPKLIRTDPAVGYRFDPDA